MSVQQYELELVVKSPSGKERILTLTEWAYDAKDAFTQATYNMVKKLEPGEQFVRLEQFGPPQELINKTLAIVQQAQEAFTKALARK